MQDQSSGKRRQSFAEGLRRDRGLLSRDRDGRRFQFVCAPVVAQASRAVPNRSNALHWPPHGLVRNRQSNEAEGSGRDRRGPREWEPPCYALLSPEMLSKDILEDITGRTSIPTPDTTCSSPIQTMERSCTVTLSRRLRCWIKPLIFSSTIATIARATNK